MAKVRPKAILMGLLTSLLGYLKQTPPESFELDKFLATAIISVIMGILTLGFGWDYTTAQEWLANGAIVHLLDRQDNSNKNRLDQTSAAAAAAAAAAYSTNIALRNWRVSTMVDMMTKLPFFRNTISATQRVTDVRTRLIQEKRVTAELFLRVYH